MTTVEVLKEARALVAKGWCQESNAVNAHGVCVDAHGNDACYWCVIGALTRARPLGERDFSAWDAFKAAAGITTAIYVWNDAPGRTQAEVLAVFDKAIAAHSKQ